MMTVLTAAAAVAAFASAAAAPIPVKVLIVTASQLEAFTWLLALGNTTSVRVPGLSSAAPDVACTAAGVCVVSTGMGHANSAASLAALAFGGVFDLRAAYVLVCGIAGVDPLQGTLGSAAWARYAVSFALSWELDAREMPAAWSTGYLGVNTASPADKPAPLYGTEVYRLNETMLQAALALSSNATLADSDGAITYRSNYTGIAAMPPSVIQCDSLSADTWWAGAALSDRARAWAKLMTDGGATYCMAQQEDNAALEVLTRAHAAGLADFARVALLRTGSDFDRPPPGGSAAANLLGYAAQGGLEPALENLVRAGAPLVDAIVTGWSEWRDGVPLLVS